MIETLARIWDQYQHIYCNYKVVLFSDYMTMASTNFENLVIVDSHAPISFPTAVV